MKKIIIALGILLVVIESAFMFFYMPRFAEVSGGQSIPDMRMEGEALREDFQKWSPAASQLYKEIQILDVIFPLTYGFFFFLAIRASIKGFKKQELFRKVLALPFITMILDLGENGLTRLLLIQGEAAPYSLYAVRLLLTSGKFLFLALTFVCFIVLVVMSVIVRNMED